MSTWYIIPKDDDLMHYGVKGMKWRNKKGSMYKAESKTGSGSSSKKGSVSRDNDSLTSLKGQLARLLAANKISDSKIDRAARDWNKVSKQERNAILSVFRSVNPKAYRKLITAIAKYNKKKSTGASIKKGG